MATNVADLVKTFIQVLTDLETARYTSAAAVTIYVYDILITFDLELQHVWSRLRFNLPTILYLTNRYLCLGLFLVPTYNVAGFHGPFSDQYCRNPVILIGFLLAYTGWATIMTLRVCALWGQWRVFVRLIWFCYACAMAGILVTSYISYKEMIMNMKYNFFIRICAPGSDKKRILSATFIGPLALEIILTVLALVRAFDFGTELFDFTTPMLYRVLARDGVAYFVISMVLSVGNMIALLRLASSQTYLFLYLYWSLMSTLTARLVLNLKVVYYRYILEQRGSEGISTRVTLASRNTTQIRRPETHFIMGEGDLGVDILNPVPKVVKPEELDDVWHVPDTHGVQSAPLRLMNSVETARTRAEGVEYQLGQSAHHKGEN